MRRAAKVDRNHAEIVAAFRQCGARVLDLSRVGQGCPDLLVYVGTRLCLIEVKTPKGKLTREQELFQQAGWPFVVIRDVAMVPVIVRTLRRLTEAGV